MKRTIILYGIVMAACASLLQWIRYRHVVQLFTTEVYVGTVAALFTGLGIWVGMRVARPSQPAEFAVNDKALKALAISPREYEVLQVLAEGLANKEIAARLHVSPNTVKTHLSRLFQKLEVARRTEAVHKARSLSLIP